METSLEAFRRSFPGTKQPMTPERLRKMCDDLRRLEHEDRLRMQEEVMAERLIPKLRRWLASVFSSSRRESSNENGSMKLMVAVKNESVETIWEFGTLPDGHRGGMSNRLFRTNGVGPHILAAIQEAERQAEAEFVLLRPNNPNGMSDSGVSSAEVKDDIPIT